jgi:hypothetical protein
MLESTSLSAFLVLPRHAYGSTHHHIADRAGFSATPGRAVGTTPPQRSTGWGRIKQCIQMPKMLARRALRGIQKCLACIQQPSNPDTLGLALYTAPL